MNERLQSQMIAHGALVFLAGLLAGFPFAFLLLGKIVLWPIPGAIAVAMPGDVRGWRMAHLEGILNGLTLIGVAAVGARLRLSERAQQTVAWALIVTAWGNMIASIVGPLFGGRGLAFGEGIANNLMYLLFVAAIVAVVVAMCLVFAGARRSALSDSEPARQ
ncbi:MAG TPA: hypothetical protein VMW17_12070 [Candidatus Binatia bacterium]|nr:hypothetical protein [Candidatus Binatia bacterium]